MKNGGEKKLAQVWKRDELLLYFLQLLNNSLSNIWSLFLGKKDKEKESTPQIVQITN